MPATKTANPKAFKNSGVKLKSSKKKQNEKDSMLKEFFQDELKDIYWAEQHLVITLPKMSKAATSKDLKSAFNDHLEVTKEHVKRLEEIFRILEQKPRAKKCDAMDGIIKEGKSIIEDTYAGTATRDVGLILAGQKVEHYEIATYGGLSQLAKTLGFIQVAEILNKTLLEEKEADESLSDLAESVVNDDAVEEN